MLLPHIIFCIIFVFKYLIVILFVEHFAYHIFCFTIGLAKNAHLGLMLFILTTLFKLVPWQDYFIISFSNDKTYEDSVIEKPGNTDTTLIEIL